MSLTLPAVRRIAMEYVPKTARDDDLIADRMFYGPAHEIGHLLTSARWRFTRVDFAMSVNNPTWHMLVSETAACIVHTWIVVATKEWRSLLPRRLIAARLDAGKLTGPRLKRAASAVSLVAEVRAGWSRIHAINAEHGGWDRQPLILQRAREMLTKRGIDRRSVQDKRSLELLCRRALT